MSGKWTRAILAALLLVNLLGIGFLAVPGASAATITITKPANLGNWAIQNTTCGAASTAMFDFVSGPAPTPLGSGSARFQIGSNGDSYGGFRSSDFHGVRLDTITSLGYSTYVSDFADGQAPFMNLSLDADGDGDFDSANSDDTTLFFEPVYQTGGYSGETVPPQGLGGSQPVALDQWQTWDALIGGWWDGTGGPPLVTIASFLASHPNATIISPGSGLGGLAVRAGCGGAAWADFVGNLDNVTVGVDDNERRFDFEANPTSTTTVEVTPISLGNWQFAEESPAGTSSFVDGPERAPLGEGSAQLTVDATGRMILFNAASFQGLRLDAIDTLAYSSYQAVGAPDPTAISLQLNIDYDLTDGNTNWQGRLVYEPYQDPTNTVTTGEWQDWDATASTAQWWASGAPGNGACPQANTCSWEEVLQAFPNAGIHATLGAINFRAGGPWAPGFTGNVDKFSITVNGANTVYDFDPTPQVTLTLTTSGDGTVTVAPPGGSFTNTSQTYDQGTQVTLTPNAGAGQYFVGWTIDGAAGGSASPLILTMNASHTVQANFAPIPQATLTLTTSGTGSVTVAPPGGSFTSTTQNYAVGTDVTLTPEPGANQAFVGWVIDGVDAGWASPLTVSMDDSHTVEAEFAPVQTFPDIDPSREDYEAIVELASRGYILGYTNGTFGPDDEVLRAQMAALIARATPKSVADGAANLIAPPNCTVAETWDCEVWNDVNFTDLGLLDPNLKRDIQVLAHYGVALGYGDGTFGPNDGVTYAQAISFITRAMVAKGYWQNQPNAPQPYSGVPADHDGDVRTFVFYTGGVPEAPNDPPSWDTIATRGWFARALWAALSDYWGVDGPMSDGDPAGGFQP